MKIYKFFVHIKPFLTNTKINQALKIKNNKFILIEIKYYKKTMHFILHKIYLVTDTNFTKLIALNFWQSYSDYPIVVWRLVRFENASPINQVMELLNPISHIY